MKLPYAIGEVPDFDWIKQVQSGSLLWLTSEPDSSFRLVVVLKPFDQAHDEDWGFVKGYRVDPRPGVAGTMMIGELCEWRVDLRGCDAADKNQVFRPMVPGETDLEELMAREGC